MLYEPFGWHGGSIAAPCCQDRRPVPVRLVMGSVVHGLGDQLGDNTAVRAIVTRMGGTGASEQAFLALAFMIGMAPHSPSR